MLSVRSVPAAKPEVAPDALRTFFNALDVDLDEIVSVNDFRRFVAEHSLAFDDDAISTLFAAVASKNFTGEKQRTPGMTRHDLRKATGPRARADTRDMLITMIRKLSPNPFKQILKRPQTTPILTMFEREEKVQEKIKSARSQQRKPQVRTVKGKIDPEFFKLFAPGSVGEQQFASGAVQSRALPPQPPEDALARSESTAALLRSISPSLAGFVEAKAAVPVEPPSGHSSFAVVDEYNAVMKSQHEQRPHVGGSQLQRRNTAQLAHRHQLDAHRAALLAGNVADRLHRPAIAAAVAAASTKPKFVVDFHVHDAKDLRAAVAKDQELFARDPYRAPSATVRQAHSRELDEKSRALAFERRPHAVQEMQRLQALDSLPEFQLTFKHKSVTERHREMPVLERDSYAETERSRLAAVGLGPEAHSGTRDGRPAPAGPRFDAVFKPLASLDGRDLAHAASPTKLSKQARQAQRRRARLEAERLAKKRAMFESPSAPTLLLAGGGGPAAPAMDDPDTPRTAAVRALPFATVSAPSLPGTSGSGVGALTTRSLLTSTGRPVTAPAEDRIHGLVPVHVLTPHTLRATPLEQLRAPFRDPDGWRPDSAPAATRAVPQPAAAAATRAAAAARAGASASFKATARDRPRAAEPDLSSLRVSPRDPPSSAATAQGLSASMVQRLALAGYGTGGRRDS